MNKLFYLILVTFLITFDGFSALADPTNAKQEPLKIGAILTLSGNFASAGDDSRRGIEAALTTQGASNLLQIIYEDSQNEPSVAIAALRKLKDIDKVSAIYTHRSSIGMALNPISMQNSMPLLGAVGHQNFASSNPFALQVWPKAHDEGAFVAEEFKRRNYKKVAVIYTEDEWTNSVSEGFRNKAKELGVQLVFDRSVLPNEQDFRTQLLQLKATSPDAIYFNLLLPQIAPALKQSKVVKLPGNFFGNFYFAKKEVRDAVDADTLEGIRYLELDNSLPNLQKKLGKDEPAPGLAVSAYVTTLLLLQTLENSPMPHNSEELMTALSRQNEVRTTDGTFIVQDRCIKFPLAIKVMSNGKFVKEGAAG